jgi:exodeoxyribonuclease-3
MKLATWNVNSIKARLDHVKRWLEDNQPDVLMMQELKDTEFPDFDFQALGYQSVAVTQKAYNGVATLSRHPIQTVFDRLPNDPADDQARYLETDIQGVRVINIYLPNGNPVESEKYPYKLAWMERLKNRIQTLRDERVPFLIGGDFNVIPDERDCFDPKVWAEDALFRPETRRAFRGLLNLGLTDAFRVFNQAPAQYTFWDYQGGAWAANKGIRIDHFLLSPALADRLEGCTIDSAPRGWDKASDHTPVILTIS